MILGLERSSRMTSRFWSRTSLLLEVSQLGWEAERTRPGDEGRDGRMRSWGFEQHSCSLLISRGNQSPPIRRDLMPHVQCECISENGVPRTYWPFRRLSGLTPQHYPSAPACVSRRHPKARGSHGRTSAAPLSKGERVTPAFIWNPALHDSALYLMFSPKGTYICRKNAHIPLTEKDELVPFVNIEIFFSFQLGLYVDILNMTLFSHKKKIVIYIVKVIT